METSDETTIESDFIVPLSRPQLCAILSPPLVLCADLRCADQHRAPARCDPARSVHRCPMLPRRSHHHRLRLVHWIRVHRWDARMCRKRSSWSRREEWSVCRSEEGSGKEDLRMHTSNPIPSRSERRSQTSASPALPLGIPPQLASAVVFLFSAPVTIHCRPRSPIAPSDSDRSRCPATPLLSPSRMLHSAPPPSLCARSISPVC